MHAQRSFVEWQADGFESSVALSVGSGGYAFVVNGKADGSARVDAGTQVMLASIGSILHPNPRHSLVIGLGTGSSAGWLGVVPVDGTRRRRRARADRPGRGAAIARRQPGRAQQPEGARAHRRCARGAADGGPDLRSDCVRALESVPRGYRQPLHAGVLPRRQRSVDRRRAVPAVAPGVWRRRVGRPDRLRDDGVGVSIGRNLADPRRRHRAGRREARAGLRPGADCRAHPGRTVPSRPSAWHGGRPGSGLPRPLSGWRSARARDRVSARRPDQYRRSQHRRVRLRAIARTGLPDGFADTRAGPCGRCDPAADRCGVDRLGGRRHVVGEPDRRRRRRHPDQPAGEPGRSRAPARPDSLLPRGQPRGRPRHVGAAVRRPGRIRTRSRWWPTSRRPPAAPEATPRSSSSANSIPAKPTSCSRNRWSAQRDYEGAAAALERAFATFRRDPWALPRFTQKGVARAQMLGASNPASRGG